MLRADGQAPAGGAPLEDLIPATVIGVLGMVFLAAIAARYVRGGATPLRAAAAAAARLSGMPVWVALPTAVSGLSLLSAVFGFYWDVSTHIDNGRDPGPFANPSHFFILFGLAGIALAGYLSVLLGSDSERRATFVGFAPLGGVLLSLCGVIALAGFPLDDVWHRLFGQDVTLWGPTHIQMVGGAALTTLSMWILIREGRPEAPVGTENLSRLMRLREVTLGGAFLVGLSALQAEFDFGAPQFQLVYQPVLLMLAAGIGLVAARVRLGRGGALWSALFFIALRAILSLLVGPILGRTMPHFPLYLVEALVVEAVALRLGVANRLRFALVAGGGIGTLGLAAEWGWAQVWMDNPWPGELLPEAVLLGVAAALSGALLGAFIGHALDRSQEASAVVPGSAAFAALCVALLCLAYPAPTSPPARATATVDLDFIEHEGFRSAIVTARPNPRTMTDDPIWFRLLSWQGHEWKRGSKRLVGFDEVEPGVFRSVEPVPVEGQWKTLIRLHNEGYLVALPLYMPEDRAIPAREIPASPRSTRAFVPDKEVLQREAKGGNLALQRIGYSVLGLIGLAWIAAFGWGLRRLAAPGRIGAAGRPLGKRLATSPH